LFRRAADERETAIYHVEIPRCPAASGVINFYAAASFANYYFSADLKIARRD
jgi:hypothetical protein